MQAIVDSLLENLVSGGRVVIHCRQGVGRAGLTAACVLLAAGENVGSALQVLTEARGVEIPETNGQQVWIEGYADGKRSNDGDS